MGSDTGGSIRLPAAWCGLVGFKPSYGASSRYGLIQYASSLDTPALLCKDTADTRALFAIIRGEDPKDSTSVSSVSKCTSLPRTKTNSNFVFGIPKEYNVSELPAETRDIWRESISLLQKAGHKAVEISLPHTAVALSAYYVIAPAEASSNLARYDGVRFGHCVDGATLQDQFTKTRTAAFGSEVQRRILMGAFALSRRSYESYYKKSLQVRRLVSQDFAAAFNQVDFILTPTSPVPAPSIENLKQSDPVNMYMMDVMTIPANLAGIPAINVPTRTASNGLPVGLQLLASRNCDDSLLDAASVLEKVWSSSKPVLQISG